VDACLGRMAVALEEAGGAALITADHGNVEMMRDAITDIAHTAHTTNLVPAVLIGRAALGGRLRDGFLADVAPTLLQLMALDVPPQMTGSSLFTTDHGVQPPHHAVVS